MSVFVDAPFERCSLCQEWVFMDQAPEDCAVEREHRTCPLRTQFNGRLFVDGEGSAQAVDARLRTITQAVVAAPRSMCRVALRLKAS